MRQNDETRRQQLLADLEHEKVRHEQLLVHAKQSILLERARRDPFGYGFDGLYRDLSDVDDTEAEVWLKQHLSGA